jgi:hypothetical protein
VLNKVNRRVSLGEYNLQQSKGILKLEEYPADKNHKTDRNKEEAIIET